MFALIAYGVLLFVETQKVGKKVSRSNAARGFMKFGCESSKTTLTSPRGSLPAAYSISPFRPHPSPLHQPHKGPPHLEAVVFWVVGSLGVRVFSDPSFRHCPFFLVFVY
jgi:hypothetical protein